MEKALLYLVLILIFSEISFSDTVYQPPDCPGLFCGRQVSPNGTYSDCGACPRGSQPNEASVCMACEGTPSLYDWLYLGFMAQLSLLLHWFFIDCTNRSWKSSPLVVLHICAVVESAIAVILTLLLSDPIGSLSVKSCSVEKLEDWYTMFYNPSPNYTTTLHCTQEIVYPLYTIVMVYYAFCLLLLMILRPVISLQFVEGKGTKSIYAALYFLPILIVLQAVFGGLIYYAFPYIMIVLSLVSSAVHMSSTKQDFKDLWREHFGDARNLTIVIGHWVLHAYGIISLTELSEPSFHGPLLVLVFFPVFFYIFTAKFTDPDNLNTTE